MTGTRAEEIGDALLADQRVRKLTFTGSTEVGKTLMRKAADTVKRLSLELGGQAPYLVFADADLEQAAIEVTASKFRNAGQTCVCTNRVYVQHSIKEEFAAILARHARELKVGNGLKEGVQVGPLIDEQALDKVESHVRDAVDQGARVLTGGRKLCLSEQETGCFYEPTVLLDTTEHMRVEQEETFGPVLPIHAFDTEEEALALANNTPFGLAAYLYTRDLSARPRFRRVGVWNRRLNDGRLDSPGSLRRRCEGKRPRQRGRPLGNEEYLGSQVRLRRIEVTSGMDLVKSDRAGSLFILVRGESPLPAPWRDRLCQKVDEVDSLHAVFQTGPLDSQFTYRRQPGLVVTRNSALDSFTCSIFSSRRLIDVTGCVRL